MASDPTKDQLPPLPPRGAAFARAVAAGVLPLKAAEEAGFAPSKAEAAAKRLLANPAVRATIRVMRLKEIDAAAILLEVANIAMADIGDLYDPKTGGWLPVDEMPVNARRAIAAIKIETGTPIEKKLDDGTVTVVSSVVTDVTLNSKNKALDMFGRYLALWKDKLDVNLTLTLEQLVLAADKKIREEKTST